MTGISFKCSKINLKQLKRHVSYVMHFAVSKKSQDEQYQGHRIIYTNKEIKKYLVHV